MWTVTMLVVITVWMMWHICWRARLSSFICSCCHVHLSSWLFIHFCCPLWVATSPMAMWLLFLVWKRSGAGGYGAHLNLVCCSYTSHVVVVGPLSVAASPFSMWPLLFKWENERGLLLKLWGQWQWQASSWMTWHVCWHARSLPWAVVLHPAGDMAMLCCCCC